MSREGLLRDLIELRRPAADVEEELTGFPWDSDELVRLARADALRVIDRFLENELSARECEAWADAIEVRDDVGFEVGSEASLRQFIFELANPALEGPLTPALARRWRTALT